MRRIAYMIIAALLLTALALPAPAVTADQPRGDDDARTVDSVAGATPNYRTFLNGDVKEMPETGGSYTCLKAQAPFTYFTQDWYGVKLSYLLDVEVGLKEGTTAIKVLAADGYSVTLTLDELRRREPGRALHDTGMEKGRSEQGGSPSRGTR